MAKGTKREILPRTVKWEVAARQPDLQKLLIKTSDGLREYEHWALEAEAENYKRFEEWQTLLGLLWDIKVTFGAQTKKELLGVLMSLIIGNEEAARLGKGRGELDRLLRKFNRETRPKSFLTDFDLYSRYAPMREEDGRETKARATIPANWVLESCFRKISAAYQSFFKALEGGDPDTRTINPSEEWDFVAIQGALTQSSLKGKTFVLAPRIFPGMFEFPIPQAFQARMLAHAKRLAKFVISRRPLDLRKPGRFWISVTYEIEKPETQPFNPEEAVYVALGASSIGIVSPRGEEVIKLWRSDKHWKPLIDDIGHSLTRKATQKEPFPVQKGSNKWRKLQEKRNKMFDIMARQQTLDRREVVAIDLIEHRVEEQIFGHGLQFVVIEYDIRSKEDKLADSAKPERGGSLGLNWMAQNTGTIGYLVQWLEGKVAECGGTVRRHRLRPEAIPKGLSLGHENKIRMARALRDDFLKTYSRGAAA